MRESDAQAHNPCLFLRRHGAARCESDAARLPGADVVTGHQLCRGELDRFRALVDSGAPITVGCTQEAPLFRDVATNSRSDVNFVNLRETAGWSVEATSAGPKMAALVATAVEPIPDIPYVRLESAGVVLVYGRDERAIKSAGLLKDHLDVTVMITRPDSYSRRA